MRLYGLSDVGLDIFTPYLTHILGVFFVSERSNVDGYHVSTNNAVVLPGDGVRLNMFVGARREYATTFQ